MDLVTAVRSQVPPPASPSQPALDRLTNAPAAQSVRPVVETVLPDAVTQPASRSAAAMAHLSGHGEDASSQTEARAAADAARTAYIRASIAAGISPLPVP